MLYAQKPDETQGNVYWIVRYKILSSSTVELLLRFNKKRIVSEPAAFSLNTIIFAGSGALFSFTTDAEMNEQIMTGAASDQS